MQTKIAMTFKTKSRYFDEDTGECFDELSSVASGCLMLGDKGNRILYREKGEDGEQILTELDFSQKDELKLKKSGAARYELTFKENCRHSFVYYAPPLSFDGEVFTHCIKNSMCFLGGNITVEYSMDMGGHRQKVSISIDAEANKK